MRPEHQFLTTYAEERRYLPGLRAVTKVPRGAVRERLARRRRISLGLPEQRHGARWERDGKAGRQKVVGMGWELIISRWDGNGREIKRSGNKSLQQV